MFAIPHIEVTCVPSSRNARRWFWFPVKWIRLSRLFYCFFSYVEWFLIELTDGCVVQCSNASTICCFVDPSSLSVAQLPWYHAMPWPLWLSCSVCVICFFIPLYFLFSPLKLVLHPLPLFRHFVKSGIGTLHCFLKIIFLFMAKVHKGVGAKLQCCLVRPVPPVQFCSMFHQQREKRAM